MVVEIAMKIRWKECRIVYILEIFQNIFQETNIREMKNIYSVHREENTWKFTREAEFIRSNKFNFTGE